ncbi:sister chromatid cohesion 1 protein 2 isoform X2 [Gossypium australe]|uniref:Sister chromatid cohesion 1 protein 2 isoform X2 n=1 Tax=Gossypium australe TaxID=47621 RepID=A0A5B6U8K3_9ROSI|nr:sister chromatid cohesion 1 protein 2 isoform X2 [Gossypium australe]
MFFVHMRYSYPNFFMTSRWMVFKNQNFAYYKVESLMHRMVGERLQMSFLDQREKKEEEKVNLSQLLEGKTKKASVRLFYEILVLKSTGLVDVQQEEAFSDIVVVKGPKWEEMGFCLGRHVK